MFNFNEELWLITKKEYLYDRRFDTYTIMNVNCIGICNSEGALRGYLKLFLSKFNKEDVFTRNMDAGCFDTPDEWEITVIESHVNKDYDVCFDIKIMPFVINDFNQYRGLHNII